MLHTIFLAAYWALTVHAWPQTGAGALDQQLNRRKPGAEVNIFVAPTTFTSPGVRYGHAIILADGSILATFENYDDSAPRYFPVYQSLDGGLTWSPKSQIRDTVHGVGLRFEPTFLQLPVALGEFPAGTIVLAGNSCDQNVTVTRIDIYASQDGGTTWQFVATIASGFGPAAAGANLPRVWEPFLMMVKGQLGVYYSDQRNPAFGQQLSHQTSADLRTWTAPATDVEFAGNTNFRPGMTCIAALPNGMFIMTYEYGNLGADGLYTYPIHYRISDDPLNWNTAVDYPLVLPNGDHPASSAQIIWHPYGGIDGTLVLNALSNTEIWVNQALGDPGAWRKIPTGMQEGYSRWLGVVPGTSKILIVSGGWPWKTPSWQRVSSMVFDLATAL